jgi:hypothetical protein
MTGSGSAISTDVAADYAFANPPEFFSFETLVAIALKAIFTNTSR